MKISFVLDCFEGGGKERRCLQLIQGLNKAGYNNIQVIIVNNDVAYKELYEAKISLHIIDRKIKKLNFFQTYIALYKLLDSFNPDIVQVWGMLGAFYINFIRCFKKFKLIGAYVADCNKPKFFSVEKIIVSINIFLADYIIGNSKAGLKAYNIPLKKGKVIYNGFNESRYKNNSLNITELKKKTNINSKHIVSMLARLDDYKDHETYINAAKLILKDRSDVVFLIVGKGKKIEYLKSLISQKQSEYIQFLGFRSDVEDIIKISNVTVLCTNPLVHKEGVSNSILESFAFGVPVIATNDGGTPEIVKSNINGYLINEFDYLTLKDKILEIINNDELHANLSKNAINIVKEKFTLNSMTKKYIELYQQLT